MAGGVSDELPICKACGSQFDAEPGTTPTNCKICDDPRQFVPPTGQAWTTMSELKKTHKNLWKQDEVHDDMWTIWTEPKFAIGQRCFLLKTPHGNVLWDMITLLDDATVDFINSQGLLHSIIISHPHYYTTHSHWVRTFDCAIHLSSEDRSWLCQPPPPDLAHLYMFMEGQAPTNMEVLPGVRVIKTGGHFPGSLVLCWRGRLLVADSIVTVPSAHTPSPRPNSQITYTFAYSIPNMIPLSATAIKRIWRAVEPFEFEETHGAFAGMEVRGRDGETKRRLEESVGIVVGALDGRYDS